MTPSLLSLVTLGAKRLGGPGAPPEAAARDAALLARAVLGWDHAWWLAHRHEPAPAGFAPRFETLLARRTRHEPVAYILGEREFYGRPFVVTPAVLIPRPETELTIERARAWLAARGLDAPDILDIGTGSGCLAITLALECPQARVVGTDLSADALEVAGRNAARHGVTDRITWRCGDLADGLERTADLIVANPPYVAEVDRAALAADVRDFEPAAALFGGPDGLAVIRRLLPEARRALRPRAALIMEIGAGQWPAVQDLVHLAGFPAADMFPDLAGIPRVVVAAVP